MCELLGISSNTEINPGISIKSFRTRGETNADGWGIAYYPDESVQIIKEAMESGRSRLSGMLADYEAMKSKIFICHVRKASRNMEVCHKNTHPFHRGLFGKDYVFAHNGTIRNFQWPATYFFKPVGKTDSEHFFCLLMEKIITGKMDPLNENMFDDLWAFFYDINSCNPDSGSRPRTKLNGLFSDGEYLVCYHSRFNDDRYHDHDKRLYWLERNPGYIADVRNLEDINYDINLRIEKDLDQQVAIVATEKLTNEAWTPFRLGEMRIYREGRLIFTSHTEPEEITVDEVYDAPSWLCRKAGAPYVIGIPGEMRNELCVSEGDNVEVLNIERKIMMTVFRTARELTRAGDCTAGNYYSHACIPERARQELGLVLDHERNTPRFKKVYSGVKIIKV